MNIEDLKQRILDLGIDEDCFSFDGGFPNEKYCIYKNENVWEVYYSERGQKTNLKIFEFENEACEYFLKQFIS